MNEMNNNNKLPFELPAFCFTAALQTNNKHSIDRSDATINLGAPLEPTAPKFGPVDKHKANTT